MVSLLLIMGLVISMVIYLSPNLDFGNVQRTVSTDPMDGVPGSGGDGYAFMQIDSSGDPITWACEERIEIVVNPEGAPREYAEMVESAVSQVNGATTFEFVVTGETDDRDFFGRGRGPVLLGWADEEELSELAGPTAGLGGSSYVLGPGGEARAVGGMVVVDKDSPGGGWFRGGIDQEVIIAHELIHVLGLGHTEQADQLMAAENSGQLELGEGDLAGLAALEDAACG